MNEDTDSGDLQRTAAPKRRGCLACLGRGAIGFLRLLLVASVAGAIYRAVASASDLRKYRRQANFAKSEIMVGMAVV